MLMVAAWLCCCHLHGRAQSMTTVNSIAEWNALPDNTEALLYLAPTDNAGKPNARVLHAYEGELYIRDHSGALLVYLDDDVVCNPAPRHNQHVAGWIAGKKLTVGGMPRLQSTWRTNTQRLVLAEPVTEPDVEPQRIAADAAADHLADWVYVQDVRTGTTAADVRIDNRFGLTAADYWHMPTDGSRVDVSGIVGIEGTTALVAPVCYADIRPVTYVLDENDEQFTLPQTAVDHASVRLRRTFNANEWTTLAVPFNMPVDGTTQLRTFDRPTDDGSILVFTEADGIEAGKPYLIQMPTTVSELNFRDVTLSPAAAQTTTTDGYQFVGTYRPLLFDSDGSERLLDSDGYLYIPDFSDDNPTPQLQGMRAYFVVPADAPQIRIDVDGTLLDDISGIRTDRPATSRIYTISGQYVGTDLNALRPGLYIVNGKKLFIY